MPDFLEGTVDAPVIGRVKKRYIMIPAGLAGVYVAWRWYQAKQDGGGQDDPGASGLYSSDDLSEYGLSTTGGSNPVTGNTGSQVTDGTSPNVIDDNAEWTAAALERLTNQGYDGATVAAALGEFLAKRSLDPSEASIARAALALAGQPPVGGPYAVNEAATTGTAVPAAVTGLKVTKSGTTYVNLAWTPQPGVTEYAVYRSDSGNTAVRAGAGSTTVYGLQPGTSYSFTVAGVGSSGKVGPKSAPVTAKTGAQDLKQPAVPTVSALTRTSFRASTTAIPGATRYRWYLSGREQPSTEGPYRDFTGLKPNTTYSVGVQADAQGQSAGHMSATRSVKTKK